MYRKALVSGFGSCPYCHKLNPHSSGTRQCTRCRYVFSPRKKHSVQLTSAWAIAALVMFIPANLFPMMTVSTLGKSEASTILEGIAIFIQLDMYPIALIIFIASFIIPLTKIFGLSVLIYHTKKHSKLSRRKQTKLFSLIEVLGQWSMLDVFVVVVLAAVVNFGFFTSIEAEIGLTYFALMVIFTMFASASFDSRLIWDIERREIYD